MTICMSCTLNDVCPMFAKDIEEGSVAEISRCSVYVPDGTEEKEEECLDG